MYKNWIISVSLYCLITSVGFAGEGNEGSHGVGNGGNGVVSQGKVVLMDLWEAEFNASSSPMDEPLRIVRSGLSVEEQIANATKRMNLNPRDLEAFDNELTWVLSHFKPLAKELALTPVKEDYPRFRPVDGSFELLANYLPDGKILYNAELVDRLEKTDLAALYVHEVLYRLGRDFHDWDTSVMVRRLNAYAFAEGDHTSEIKKLVTELFGNLIENRVRINHSDRAEDRLTLKYELMNPGVPTFWTPCRYNSADFYTHFIPNDKHFANNKVEPIFLSGPGGKAPVKLEAITKSSLSPNQMKSLGTDIEVVVYPLWRVVETPDAFIRISLWQNGKMLPGSERIIHPTTASDYLRNPANLHGNRWVEVSYEIR